MTYTIQNTYLIQYFKNCTLVCTIVSSHDQRACRIVCQGVRRRSFSRRRGLHAAGLGRGSHIEGKLVHLKIQIREEISINAIIKPTFLSSTTFAPSGSTRSMRPTPPTRSRGCSGSPRPWTASSRKSKRGSGQRSQGTIS